MLFLTVHNQCLMSHSFIPLFPPTDCDYLRPHYSHQPHLLCYVPLQVVWLPESYHGVPDGTAGALHFILPNLRPAPEDFLLQTHRHVVSFIHCLRFRHHHHPHHCWDEPPLQFTHWDIQDQTAIPQGVCHTQEGYSRSCGKHNAFLQEKEDLQLQAQEP